MTIPATVRPAGGRKFQTVVRDLSLSGFCATAISRIAPKTTCWLTLPDLESKQAHVVWWEQGLVGCAFDQLLTEVDYERVLARWRGTNTYAG